MHGCCLNAFAVSHLHRVKNKVARMAPGVEHPIKPFVYIIALVASISGFLFG